mgnify:CR=1 FL=1
MHQCTQQSGRDGIKRDQSGGGSEAKHRPLGTEHPACAGLLACERVSALSCNCVAGRLGDDEDDDGRDAIVTKIPGGLERTVPEKASAHATTFEFRSSADFLHAAACPPAALARTGWMACAAWIQAESSAKDWCLRR